MHLYVSQIPWSAGCFDPLLRQVADYVIVNVLLADTGLRWLYHPYDGGMDIMLPSTATAMRYGIATVVGFLRTQPGCNDALRTVRRAGRVRHRGPGLPG